MHDATSQSSNFRLAIAPGVPSSQLSALLALQRKEEPEVTIAFFEVAGDAVPAGLLEGRYGAGISLEGLNNPSLKSQPLWRESMAVAMPMRCLLQDQAKVTLADLLDYPIFRWRAETCPLLDQRLSFLMQAKQSNAVQSLTSFDMMALWVAAGYGLGISAQSRIGDAHGWGIGMKPLSDGPYEIVAHLQRPHGQTNSVSERFERRALQVARAGAA
ncbi:substrate-binding domain-containing protein [Pseudomonas aeruginosa]|uniref:substrate-binding domain-containing protein n=1 Tax=Pseudomonas aeruginosa TaxID=287 RepID=UPI000BAA437F|nr:substrate-binding domain-containing protein [Pseudomonas aeruginosa]PAT50202.1 LysR family transcriptional regulator [Pseudomonas aeruginosa]PCA39224.1 LysR family transcriptional regulator [Pseudomonas aeruginosa]PCA40946.1 LysR family transcriptional regulator [Pseudomonas aeruginosa]